MTEVGTRAPDRFKLSRLRSGFSSEGDDLFGKPVSTFPDHV